MIGRRVISVTIVASCVALLNSLGCAEEAVDTAALRPDQLDFAFFKPRVDPSSGFVLGGKNATHDLKRLTAINGRSIQELETAMRPGAWSKNGFLGKDERLVDVLVADNQFVVEQSGFTHQELARPLLVIGYYAQKQAIGKSVRLRHGEVEMLVKVVRYRGFQESPFEDGTKTNIDVTIKRLSDGEVLEYSLLVPHMIERYGFYEGNGTSYRVDPKAIIELLKLKKKGTR